MSAARVVLGVDVTPQIDTALERPRAPDTGERPETGVLATVSDEVRRLTERLSALTTHVRLLTCTGGLLSETNHSSLVITRLRDHFMHDHRDQTMTASDL